MTVRKSKNKFVHGDKPFILTCDKTHFSKDIDQLVLQTDLNIVRLNNGFFCFFQEVFVPADVMRQTFYQNEEYQKRYKREWIILEKFADLFILNLEKNLGQKIGIIIAAHVDYGHVDSLRLVAARRNIKFTCLVRENFILEREKIDVRDYYFNHKFKFQGDRIFVFSEATKNILAEAQVFETSKIIVTGAPRFDIWRDFKKTTTLGSQKINQTITLVSFSHPDYLAPEAFAILVKEFEKMARLVPQINFLIKAKDRGDYFRITEDLKITETSNLKISFTSDIKELLKSSNIVIGFNSLLLVEAIMAQCHVVIPYFLDSAREDRFLMYSPNFVGEKDVFTFLEKSENLMPAINNLLQRSFNYDQDKVTGVISKILYIDQKKSAAVVLAEEIKKAYF
jgi:hypothetical protein